ncbi:MAG: M20/M25/M40 family metallo-hydrolase, partial [Ruminococcus sp.]|nr:M20/M25/M40 family metallo-hydrolase [Ruminococcus sp.]
MNNLIFDLCRLSGISGDENNTAEYCKSYLEKYTKNVKVDFNNNVVAVVGDENANYTFLLDAHIDRIGLIVTEIDDNGFIKVDKVGGVDLRVVLDAPVIVHAKEDLKGIICCMPPHLSDGNEDKAVKSDKIWVDVGLPSEKVKELVNLGDNVTFFSEPKSLLNKRISAAALDNRAGVATLLNVAKNLTEKNINSRVIILLSSQEETFATGAKTVPFDYEIDECICVDVSFAAQPQVDDQYSRIKLGEGPLLCVSPNLNRDILNKLKTTADSLNQKYQLEICGGRTGTNADHIVVCKSGVKTAVISIPEKNMHTQAEIVDLNDIESTANL